MANSVSVRSTGFFFSGEEPATAPSPLGGKLYNGLFSLLLHILN